MHPLAWASFSLARAELPSVSAIAAAQAPSSCFIWFVLEDKIRRILTCARDDLLEPGELEHRRQTANAGAHPGADTVGAIRRGLVERGRQSDQSMRNGDDQRIGAVRAG